MDICVENICVLGNDHINHLVALVVPNNICLGWEKAEAESKILESLNETAKIHGLHRVEVPKKIAILFNEEWTPANGMLTGAFKLNRIAIKKQYAETIEKLFKS